MLFSFSEGPINFIFPDPFTKWSLLSGQLVSIFRANSWDGIPSWMEIWSEDGINLWFEKPLGVNSSYLFCEWNNLSWGILCNWIADQQCMHLELIHGKHNYCKHVIYKMITSKCSLKILRLWNQFFQLAPYTCRKLLTWLVGKKAGTGIELMRVPTTKSVEQAPT